MKVKAEIVTEGVVEPELVAGEAGVGGSGMAARFGELPPEFRNMEVQRPTEFEEGLGEGHGGGSLIPASQIEFASFFKDTFKDDLWRSQNAKADLEKLRPDALRVLESILEIPITDKNISTIASVAMKLAESPVIRTELPKLAMVVNRTMRDPGDSVRKDNRPQHYVSRDEVKDFARDCVEAEVMNAEGKEELKVERSPRQ